MFPTFCPVPLWPSASSPSLSKFIWVMYPRRTAFFSLVPRDLKQIDQCETFEGLYLPRQVQGNGGSSRETQMSREKNILAENERASPKTHDDAQHK